MSEIQRINFPNPVGINCNHIYNWAWGALRQSWTYNCPTNTWLTYGNSITGMNLIGPVGNQGFLGSNSKGFQGNLGFQGFLGNEIDVMGNWGNQGNWGNISFLGDQGSETSIDGIRGSQGFQGFIGRQSNSGNIGNVGPNYESVGRQGIQGFQSVRGIVGNQGFWGFRGFQGNVSLFGEDYAIQFRSNSNLGSNTLSKIKNIADANMDPNSGYEGNFLYYSRSVKNDTSNYSNGGIINFSFGEYNIYKATNISLNENKTLTFSGFSSAKTGDSLTLILGFSGENNSKIKIENGIYWPNSEEPSTFIPYSLEPGLNSRCSAVATDSNDIYVGGSFTAAGITSVNRIARWNRNTGTWSSLNGGVFNGSVKTIAIRSNGDVFVGGGFDSAGTAAFQSTPGTQSIAYWEKSSGSWKRLSNPNPFFTSASVNCMKFGPDGKLYVGGNFFNPPFNNQIARWNPTNETWEPLEGLTSITYQGNVFINSMAFDANDNLYIGGIFQTVNGMTVNNIASWNLTTYEWKALGDGLLGGIGSTDVRSIEIGSDNRVYAGGNFTGKLRVWNPTTEQWSGLPRISNSNVYSLQFNHSRNILYIGGERNNTTDKITVEEWNGSLMRVIGRSVGSPQLGAIPWDLTIDSNDNLYAVGDFTEMNNKPATRIAKWNILEREWNINSKLLKIEFLNDGQRTYGYSNFNLK